MDTKDWEEPKPVLASSKLGMQLKALWSGICPDCGNKSTFVRENEGTVRLTLKSGTIDYRCVDLRAMPCGHYAASIRVDQELPSYGRK